MTHWTDEDDSMFAEWATYRTAAAMLDHPDFASDIADPVVADCERRMKRRDHALACCAVACCIAWGYALVRGLMWLINQFGR